MIRARYYNTEGELVNEGVFVDAAAVAAFTAANNYGSLTKEELDEDAFQAELAQDLADEALGEKRQKQGRRIVARINGINSRKLTSGAMSPTLFQQLLTNPTITGIERALMNGSLGTAISLINTLDETFYTTAEKNKIKNELIKILSLE